MRWTVRLSPEVRDWRAGLTPRGKAETDRAIERLAAQGNQLRMPLPKPPGNGLFELRFTCEGTTRRISYTFEPDRNVITLTTFHKQKNNERREILRVRRAKRDLT